MIEIDTVITKIKSIMAEYSPSCDKVKKIKAYISNIEKEVKEDSKDVTVASSDVRDGTFTSSPNRIHQ